VGEMTRTRLRDRNPPNRPTIHLANPKPYGVFHVERLRSSLRDRLEVNSLVV
jgi:hypothetical protein